jgi:hypothetical protein
MQQVAELTARVAELTRRLELVEVVRSNGRAHSDTETAVRATDESSNPIEFLTENGFVIVRPWEHRGSPAPAEGHYKFAVTDPEGNEREISVRISTDLLTNTAIRTRSRIDGGNPFWICCAERHLAGYLTEQDRFPDGEELNVTELDREETLLAIRWGKSV